MRAAFFSLLGVAALPAQRDFTPQQLVPVMAKAGQASPAPQAQPSVPASERSKSAKASKQLFRRALPRPIRFTYPGKPTTVAREQRIARKRRNKLRHKARSRR